MMFTYNHKDHLGSSNLKTDSIGNVVKRIEYVPFGDKRVEVGSYNNIKNRFAGQYEDEESGLYYYQQRYYDPKLSRFISADPLYLEEMDKRGINSQSLNLYSYVKNNPLKFVDDEGLDLRDVVVAWDLARQRPGIENLPAGKDINFKFVDMKGANGMTLSPINTVLFKESYSGKIDDKTSFLTSVFHEASHFKDGFFKTIMNSEADHLKIYEASSEFGFSSVNESLESLSDSGNSEVDMSSSLNTSSETMVSNSWLD